MLTAFNMKSEISSSSSSSSKPTFEERTKSICEWRSPEEVTEADMFRTDFYYENEDAELTHEQLVEKYGIPKPPIYHWDNTPGMDIAEIPREIIEAVWRAAYKPTEVIRNLLRYKKDDSLELKGCAISKKDLEAYVIPFIKLNPSITSLDLSNNDMEDDDVEYLNQNSSLKEVNLSYNLFNHTKKVKNK